MPSSICSSSSATTQDFEADTDFYKVLVPSPSFSGGSNLDAIGKAIVGEVITVRWTANGGLYPALVIGYRSKHRTHKLYYPLDNKVEVANLAKRDWHRNNPTVPGWDTCGLVSKRIMMFLEKPYEAFVVKYHDSFTYTIIYPDDDGLDTRDMGSVQAKRDIWELFDDYNGSPDVTWSSGGAKY